MCLAPSALKYALQYDCLRRSKFTLFVPKIQASVFECWTNMLTSYWRLFFTRKTLHVIHWETQNASACLTLGPEERSLNEQIISVINAELFVISDVNKYQIFKNDICGVFFCRNCQTWFNLDWVISLCLRKQSNKIQVRFSGHPVHTHGKKV